MLGAGFAGPWTDLGDSYRIPADMISVVRLFGTEFVGGDVAGPSAPLDAATFAGAGSRTIRRWQNLEDERLLGRRIGEMTADLLEADTDLSPSEIVFLCETHRQGLEAVHQLETRGPRRSPHLRRRQRRAAPTNGSVLARRSGRQGLHRPQLQRLGKREVSSLGSASTTDTRSPRLRGDDPIEVRPARARCRRSPSSTPIQRWSGSGRRSSTALPCHLLAWTRWLLPETGVLNQPSRSTGDPRPVATEAADLDHSPDNCSAHYPIPSRQACQHHPVGERDELVVGLYDELVTDALQSIVDRLEAASRAAARSAAAQPKHPHDSQSMSGAWCPSCSSRWMTTSGPRRASPSSRTSSICWPLDHPNRSRTYDSRRRPRCCPLSSDSCPTARTNPSSGRSPRCRDSTLLVNAPGEPRVLHELIAELPSAHSDRRPGRLRPALGHRPDAHGASPPPRKWRPSSSPHHHVYEQHPGRSARGAHQCRRRRPCLVRPDHHPPPREGMDLQSRPRAVHGLRRIVEPHPQRDGSGSGVERPPVVLPEPRRHRQDGGGLRDLLGERRLRALRDRRVPGAHRPAREPADLGNPPDRPHAPPVPGADAGAHRRRPRPWPPPQPAGRRDRHRQDGDGRRRLPQPHPHAPAGATAVRRPSP